MKLKDQIASVILGAMVLGVTSGLGFWLAGRIFG